MRWLLIIILSLTLIAFIHQHIKDVEEKEMLRNELFDLMWEKDSLQSIEQHYVIGSYYNPVVNQCDVDCLFTANMSYIDTIALNNYQLRWVAISRDLLKHYNFNDTIIVHSNNQKINGLWVIKDVMNKRYQKRIDFLVPLNDTLQIGKIALKIKKYRT
ncbi:MAG TPA: hypothetical protein PLN85_01540 [archaeon]|nr:hypothetical protein [archaeon]HRT02620.1 hypothetical protein [Candidatus Diapherotrites archaeon]